jgi:hypothetical protein
MLWVMKGRAQHKYSIVLVRVRIVNIFPLLGRANCCLGNVEVKGSRTKAGAGKATVSAEANSTMQIRALRIQPTTVL